MGISFGAMPGLTSTMGVCLLMPLTFSMGPAEGMLMLIGIFCGALYGLDQGADNHLSPAPAVVMDAGETGHRVVGKVKTVAADEGHVAGDGEAVIGKCTDSAKRHIVIHGDHGGEGRLPR